MPVEPGPPERLLLLPVLGTFTYVLDLLLGLYLYRFLPLRPVSFLLWVAALITPILLIISVVYMVWAYFTLCYFLMPSHHCQPG